jgi:hypothetical protein
MELGMTRYSIVHEERDGYVVVEVIEKIREVGRYKNEADAIRERDWLRFKQEKLP